MSGGFGSLDEVQMEMLLFVVLIVVMNILAFVMVLAKNSNLIGYLFAGMYVCLTNAMHPITSHITHTHTIMCMLWVFVVCDVGYLTAAITHGSMYGISMRIYCPKIPQSLWVSHHWHAWRYHTLIHVWLQLWKQHDVVPCAQHSWRGYLRTIHNTAGEVICAPFTALETVCLPSSASIPSTSIMHCCWKTLLRWLAR